MSLHAIDAWIGKTLFHPPIILACQLLRQSQYAFSRAMWFFVFVHSLWFDDHRSWAWTAMVGVFCIVQLIMAVRFPDAPLPDHFGWRVFFLALSLVNVANYATTGQGGVVLANGVMVLFAEYARTIRTIPPRETRQSRHAARERRT